MARVLVTGGAGYVGSHCCKALADADHDPVVFDNLSTGHREAVRWGRLIEGDMRNADQVRAAMEDVQPDAVLHFAALSLVGESSAQPGRYHAVNVGGTLNLLEAMQAVGANNLIYSSTCAVYGEPDKVPITEDSPRNPLNTYGATKLACERMIEDFQAAHGLRSVSLRYFNAAGADPAAEIGEWHEPETHLIPLVLDAALGRRPAISIFGTDYATPDGTAIRDYIHVMDLAGAHLAALDHLLAVGAPSAVNLGTGTGVSVREVIRTAEAVTGRKILTRDEPRRAGDPPALLADPRRGETLLGWKARADLSAMIEDAWRWHLRMPAARVVPRRAQPLEARAEIG